MAFNVGDKVTCSAERDYKGVHLASFVRTNTYEVLKVRDNGRVVIGRNGVATAEVYPSDLHGPASASVQTKADSPALPAATGTQATQNTSILNTAGNYAQNYLTSLAKGFDSKITSMIDNYGQDITKYSMRLFGIPHQFTQYCDYRTYSVSNKPKTQLIGRTFLENIMLEAPVVSIIPGKPVYLPAKKGAKKEGMTTVFVDAANDALSSAMKTQTITEQAASDKIRYYDFQQDYTNYMRYVDIMCQVAAAFLDLESENIDGSTPLTTFMWENYRWTADQYTTASSNMFNAAKNLWNNTITKIASGVRSMLGMNSTTVNAFNQKMDDNDESTIVQKLEYVLTQMNFVQFYVDSSSSSSESNTNQTSSSKLEGMFDSANDVMKEFAFIANSGGIDNTQFEEMAGGATGALSGMLNDSNSYVGGMIGRLLGSAGNVIRGNTMIFPEIYQKSTYSKTYDITVDLRTPYGNKLSFYLNILVPLFHLMCLALPKQETANTYGSPFIVKAYYPGIFSCNLGIVQSLSITRAPNSDWSVDGYPMEIRVSLSIVDLYSDLTMTPAGSTILFLANSSLIEFIATNCGVNLITPQLSNRVKYVTAILESTAKNAKKNVENAVLDSFESKIASLTRV